MFACVTGNGTFNSSACGSVITNDTSLPCILDREPDAHADSFVKEVLFSSTSLIPEPRSRSYHSSQSEFSQYLIHHVELFSGPQQHHASPI